MLMSGREPGLLSSWPGWTWPSWHGLAERDNLEPIDLVGDGVGDEARGDRRAVEVQHAGQLRRVDLQLVDQQRTQLTVAVLLDHEHLIVLADEALHVVMEREPAHA